ncbi:MAG: NAD(P)H-binding protein [Segetibacter sp.]
MEALGAKAAIGTMEDVDFLTETFRGADAVYCMLAPFGDFADPNNNASSVMARANVIANNYVQAIEKSGVKRVVYLSSMGADMKKDNGFINIHYDGENALNSLPSDVNISFIRPGAFYKNLLGYVNAIKNQDTIAANFGGDDLNILVSNIDIADAIVDELESKVAGRKVCYVASEELTCNEAAGILGAAIGKPHLKWVTISDEEQLNGLKAYGMHDSLARNFVEMNASIHAGKLWGDYSRNKPALGKVKLKEFAKEFAAVYNQQ